jgi:hypothetical protein
MLLDESWVIQGCQRNMDRAISLFERAAKMGSPTAQCNFGNMLLFGLPVTPVLFCLSMIQGLQNRYICEKRHGGRKKLV